MKHIATILKMSVNDISEIERGNFRGSFYNVSKYLNYVGLELRAVQKTMPTLDTLSEHFSDE